MTDEECQKLCEDLDGISHDEKGVDDYVAERCLAAAEEIDRLIKENKELKKSLYHLRSATTRDIMGSGEM